MKMINILIAEDDPAIRTGLIDSLESEGYAVTAVSRGDEALDCLRQQTFQLVILDIMMPGRSGFDVCRAIRSKNTSMPVLFLTAKGEEIDKVLGLELGADDYLTKPFGLRELLARVHALLRRSRQQGPAGTPASDLPDRFAFANAVIDRHRYEATVGEGGQPVSLTAREMKLIEVFMKHPGEALTRDQLLNAAWGIDYLGTTRTLDQHVAQLRKKTECDSGNPTHLITVHGIGYRYDP